MIDKNESDSRALFQLQMNSADIDIYIYVAKFCFV